VDRGSVLSAAGELYRQRNHSEVVAACRAELAANPDDVDLRVLLARALMALRRDVEAQVEVAHCLRLRPRCATGYALLGELAFRRDELRAADIFLREALRLDERDPHARVLLDIVQTMIKPAAAAAKLPAASAAAGPSPLTRVPLATAPGAPARPRRPQSRTQATAVETDEAAVRLQRGGFGEYLVKVKVISRQQLLAVLQCHYRDRCKVGEAAVRLGYASAVTVEDHAARFHATRRARACSPARAVA